jgi:hypothetical protein
VQRGLFPLFHFVQLSTLCVGNQASCVAAAEVFVLRSLSLFALLPEELIDVVDAKQVCQGKYFLHLLYKLYLALHTKTLFLRSMNKSRVLVRLQSGHL